MDKIKTLGELAKENPDKTYNELTRIQEDARLKKEGVCITAALKKDIKGPTVFDEERKKFKKEIDYHRYWKNMYEKEHKLRQEAQGETTIVKGIGMNSPEMREKDKLIQELRMRIRDMLLISEQHRSILGAEITDRKRLEQEVKDLKVQMSEYLSVRTRGAGSVS